VKVTNRYGLLALAFGIIAIFLAFITIYAKSIYNVPGYWFAFDWLEKFGLTNNTPSTPTISQGSVFSISESNAIYWSYNLALILSYCSMASVFVAELKHEHSLLLSAAFIVASAGLILINLKHGFISVFISFFTVMFIRKKYKITLTHHSSGTPNGAPCILPTTQK
jgi:hypothetical protein